VAGESSKPESIFFAALEKPTAEEQAAYLDQACGQDTDLRRRVEKLLAAQPNVGKFLEEPLTDLEDVAEPAASQEGPGTVIGPYKLLQEIGEGGFGFVYMAEQLEPVRRLVALKIVKPGMDTREVIARFEAERQALAMMDHSNIARILDAGAPESGRPYFVMELVKGVPITEFCDKNNFEPKKRLELFMTVCRAVHHAHQKGVIHRDIKPSNIMITLHDGDPIPKVIDFGVSKAISQRLTEKTLFTRYGQMIGTPQYMSPEQAEMSGLDVDTRTDVYSLGVLLYELLTGTTPLEGEKLRTAGYSEMVRMIQTEEPAKPSTRVSSLGDSQTVVCEHRSADAKRLRQMFRGDLDWIVMKALEKHRDRRYETANEFARDIARHLNDEPVHAGPPSAAYLLSKIVRRNKLAFFAATAVLFALILGLAAAIWGFANANYHRDIAEVATNDAIVQRDEARKARAAADEARQVAADRALKFERQNYRLHLAAADEAILNENPFRCHEELQSCLPELRDWGWWFVKRRLDNAPSPLVILGRQQPIFTPDGKHLIAAGVAGSADEHNVLIWDLTARDIVGKYGAGQRLSALSMSPNGRFLAGGGVDGTLILWDRETRRRFWTVKEHGRYFDCLSVLESGLVASANSDGTLKVFERSDGSVRFSLTLKDPELRGASKRRLPPEPRKVMFSPDGRWIAVGSKPPKDGRPLVNSKPAEIIDASTGKQVAQFADGHFLPTFSPDRRTIATARLDDGYSKIVLFSWDGNDLTEEHSWQVGDDVKNPVYDLCFNPDGAHLAVMRRRYDLKVWDVKTNEQIASWERDQFRADWLAIHPEKNQIAFYHVDRRIHLWNYSGGVKEATVTKLEDPAKLVRFSPNGKLIAVGSDASVTVLDAASGNVVFKTRGKLANTPWLEDNVRLVVIRDNTIEIWNAQTGIFDRSLSETSEDQIGTFVSHDGRTLTSVGGRDWRIRSWDIDTGELLKDFPYNVNVAGVLDMSHETKRVAMGNESSTIEIWDTESQSLTHTLKTPARLYFTLRFSRDGKRLFIGELGGHGLTVHDFGAEREFQFQGAGMIVASFAVSPDGAQLVAQIFPVDNFSAKKVTVYDVETSQPLVTLLSSHEALRKPPPSKDSGLLQFDWSADGQRIAATVPVSGKLYIWTLPHGP